VDPAGDHQLRPRPPGSAGHAGPAAPEPGRHRQCRQALLRHGRGDRLTALLKEHITGAVALLQAAKSGDEALIEQRTDEWYANANEVADFLHEANSRNWPKRRMRRMMRMHLDQTLSEAMNRLSGKYEADVRDYDEIHHHILRMADALSAGIIKQFPRRFR
jgi:hypothetical protein